jgi:hypothetical protein
MILKQVRPPARQDRSASIVKTAWGQARRQETTASSRSRQLTAAIAAVNRRWPGMVKPAADLITDAETTAPNDATGGL